MLAYLIKDRNPGYLACCQDADWRPQWRVDLLASYKTSRLDLPALPQLDTQIPLIFELLTTCGVPVVGLADYEAEDIIGALISRCPGKVEIVSGDRDLFQLVKDPDRVVLYPKRGVSDLAVVDEAYIEQKYGIPGRAYADFAILRGDTSDGLPGVAGIGEKTAAALISHYKSLEAVIEAALSAEGKPALAKVRNSLDYLDRATQVVLIASELPLGEVDLSMPTQNPPEELFEMARLHGLINPVKRLVDSLELKEARS